MACVYVATNKANGKQYVGWTKSLLNRKKAHKYAAEHGADLVFSKAIRKYGWKNFTWRVLFVSSDLEEIKRTEVKMITELNCKAPYGYNMTDGGDGFCGGTFTEEHRRKLSQNSASRRPEVRAKISTAHKGKKRSPTHIRNAALARKGIPPSIAARIATSKAKLGVPLSIQHRQNISRGLQQSVKHKERMASQECRSRISNALKGRAKSECHKEKLRQANLGKKNGPPSEETRKKIAESVKKTWHLRRDLKGGRI